ncbi:MAG: hypothetical protein RL095_2344 [Verrucomicrobiota bacterium]|jgi:hypothetical protein
MSAREALVQDLYVVDDFVSFEAWLQASSLDYAGFLGEGDQRRYLETDGRFTSRINSVIRRCYPAAFAEENIQIISEVWPNHTRYILISFAAASQVFYEQLHYSLQGEFEKWRIALVFHEQLGGEVIGGLALWKDQALISRPLLGECFLKGLDLRVGNAPADLPPQPASNTRCELP